MLLYSIYFSTSSRLKLSNLAISSFFIPFLNSFFTAMPSPRAIPSSLPWTIPRAIPSSLAASSLTPSSYSCFNLASLNLLASGSYHNRLTFLPPPL